MSGSRKTLSRKKKVKILQLYEPKIEEPGNRKQSKKQRDLKNLSNQVKSKFFRLIGQPWKQNPNGGSITQRVE